MAYRLTKAYHQSLALVATPVSLFLGRFLASPHFGSISESVVGDPEHDCLSRALFYRSSKGTHFLTSLPPMIWVINQQARHWWGWVVSHHCNRSKPERPGNAGKRRAEGILVSRRHGG